MINISTATVAEINRAHHLATEHAEKAVEHAKRAGILLLQVKASVPHGDFLPWIRANVHFSPRQAQRYIAAAQGKERAAKVKSDTGMSHLAASRINDPAPARRHVAPVPEFMPRDGQWCVCSSEGCDYVVEPSVSHPGYWFVSALREEHFDYQFRPIRSEWVESLLGFYGLKSASTSDWIYQACAGVRIAGESLLSEQTIQEMLAERRNPRRQRIPQRPGARSRTDHSDSLMISKSKS